MCGPSSEEKDIAASQKQMYDKLSDNYSTAFAQQQDIVGALTKMFTPIVQAGPTQAGFAPEFSNALKTQAGEQVATDYAQAQKATQNILASRGGGDTFLPDSISANITAQTANAAAKQRATLQNQITQQDYAQGYQNWNTAANVLGQTAQLVNPNSFASSSTNAGSAASQTAQAMAMQSNSIWNSAIGALGGVAGAAMGNPAGILGMLNKGPSTAMSPGPGGMIPYVPYQGNVPYATAGGYKGG